MHVYKIFVFLKYAQMKFSHNSDYCKSTDETNPLNKK